MSPSDVDRDSQARRRELVRDAERAIAGVLAELETQIGLRIGRVEMQNEEGRHFVVLRLGGKR